MHSSDEMSNPNLEKVQLPGGCSMIEIGHRFVETNGIRMHIAEAGSGILVLLLHGLPEFWYSWRHQLVALAEAGFHAVAPDQRGFGHTNRPEEVADYTMLHLVGDVVGLLGSLGAEQAVVAGHDWGAPVALNTAQITAPSIKQALKMVSAGKPGHRVRVLFPIDREVFFVPEDLMRREVA
jgi:pimeloyl-ACP methyl ester carboxylesterase